MSNDKMPPLSEIAWPQSKLNELVDTEFVGAYRNSDGKWLFNFERQYLNRLIRPGCDYTFGPPGKNVTTMISIAEHNAAILAERERCGREVQEERAIAMAEAFEIAAAVERPFTIEKYREHLRLLASEQRDAARGSK